MFEYQQEYHKHWLQLVDENNKRILLPLDQIKLIIENEKGTANIYCLDRWWSLNTTYDRIYSLIFEKNSGA